MHIRMVFPQERSVGTADFLRARGRRNLEDVVEIRLFHGNLAQAADVGRGPAEGPASAEPPIDAGLSGGRQAGPLIFGPARGVDWRPPPERLAALNRDGSDVYAGTADRVRLSLQIRR
ncbi:hypothetical protein AHIS1636_23740 [Arthrobacter mangrovi]|uniref:Uncharacterized protein n=1 Tax=Arthrobacter mangrovi TaxID=2966350 RepID=A0ABQ5MVF6_9MICC|nr:hypothetical protein AHIS1636_23740 [Arthrobacter mangrovi]